jgi:hypothetical protein
LAVISPLTVLGSLTSGGGERRESSEPELEDFELISEDDLGHESTDL